MYRLPKTGGFMMFGSYVVDSNLFMWFGALLVGIILFRIGRFLIRRITYDK